MPEIHFSYLYNRDHGNGRSSPTANDTPEGINLHRHRSWYIIRMIVAHKKNTPDPSANHAAPSGNPLPNTSFAVLICKYDAGICSTGPGILKCDTYNL